MAGGSGGFLGRMGNRAQPASPPVVSAGYTPVQANPYSSAFSSQQTSLPPGVSPFVAQMRAQQADPIQQFGLQAMLSSAIQSEMPQQSTGIAGLPVYRPSALDYRPNMELVRQNLSRPVPSVYKTDLDAARARIADLEAQQQQQQQGGYGE